MGRTGILIVEDQGIVARDIERQLRDLNYEPVGIAATGEDAIALAGTLRPRLVLMDIHLAGAMDGIDAATAIRAQFGIPCVFLTAYATDDVVDRAKGAEPLGYVIKPFDEQRLKTTIEIALHKDLVDGQLRRSETRYRAVVESAHDAIVTANGDGTVVGWSPSAAALFGYTEAEAIGKPMRLLVLQHENDGWPGEVHDAPSTQTGRPGTLRERVGRRKDGSEFPLELSLARWETDEGRFVTRMIRDVTERKAAERSVRLQSAALNAAANSIVITDREGTIEWVNPAFTAMTGYELDEAIGKNPRDLVRSGAQDQAFYRGMWDAILAGDVWLAEMTNRRKDGSRYVEEQMITPLKDSAGRVTHFIGIKRDLTDQKQLQEQFLQAQKMEAVGQLAGGVAHEVNNLLTVILGYSEFLLKGLTDGQRVYAETIIRAGNRAAAITKQLLAFSRKQVLHTAIEDVNKLVSTVCQLLAPVIGEHIQLSSILAPELPVVRVDGGQIEQVLMNLAMNARDAMPLGGRLTIETSDVELDGAQSFLRGPVRPGRYVCLTVADTGTGMTDEIRRRALEPFFTTKEPGKGTGLGLSTVYGIVKQSDGYVWIESEVGRGTSFKVYLPVANGEGSHPLEQPANQDAATLTEDPAEP